MGFLLLALAVLVADEPPPENIAAYLKQRETQAAAEIKRLEGEIRRLAKDRSKSGREIVAKWRKRRDKIKKDLTTFVPQIPYQFCVIKADEIGSLAKSEYGEIGGRPGPVITVVQIVDEQNMIIDATWTYQNAYAKSATEVGTRVEKTVRRLWLKGFPTNKLANDAKTTINAPVEVTGNTTYETVAGSTETLFVVEPFDMAKLEPWQSQPKQKPKKR